MLSALLLALAAGGGSDAVALERALASVKPAAIRSDLFFIASDELEGATRRARANDWRRASSARVSSAWAGSRWASLRPTARAPISTSTA